MLRLASYDIVFQEVPQEVSLALNLSNCPNRCKGCHSPHLWSDVGVKLDESRLNDLLQTYGSTITCVCFMGGDADTQELFQLIATLRKTNRYNLKVAWYSGRQNLPNDIDLSHFDFIKVGAYVEKLGGLDSIATNQRFYEVECGKLIDKTAAFQKQ